MKLIFLTFLIFITTSLFCQLGLEEKDWEKIKNQNFDSLASSLNIKLSIPDEFTETEIVENSHVPYNKVFSHDSSGLEIRIWIRDIKNQQIPKQLSVDEFSKAFMTMVLLNASGYVLPDIPKINKLGSSTVSNDLNADWASISAFLPQQNSFNEGFEVCSIIGMRKNELAEVYVFFMISDRENETHLLSNLGEIVKFK